MNVVLRGLALLTLAATASIGDRVRQQRTPITLEGFDSLTGWHAVPSDGVRLALREDSGVVRGALRMDIDYQKHAGYAVARRAFTLPALPPYWAMSLRVRGDILPNTLELKFVDASGLNVWWMRKPELRVTGEWAELRFRPRDLSFAWGPRGGGPPAGIATIEIAFTAGQGGRGWLALDDLTMIPLAAPVADTVRPRIVASSGGSADRLLGTAFGRSPLRGEPLAPISWRTTDIKPQTIALAFGGARDLSGLVIDWGDAWATDVDVEASDDAAHWTMLKRIRDAAGGRRFIHLPALETSHLRLHLLRSSGGGYTMRSLRILADSAAPTTSAFLERVADASPVGAWPRSLTRQQQYWTVFGLPRDARDGLMSEDGAIDTKPGGFSLEPFVFVGDTMLTWAQGTTTQALDGDVRPMPIVTRTSHDVSVDSRAFATATTGPTGQSLFWARYRVTNASLHTRTVRLAIAIRPVQVNPPWQFLGTPGGAADIHTLSWNGTQLLVNGSDAVVPRSAPTRVALSRWDEGSAIDRLGIRTPTTIHDETALASAALEWALTIPPRDSAVVWLTLPSDPNARVTMNGTAALDSARRLWDAELSPTQIDLPGTGAPLAQTLRTALAHLLINANGPAVQPGTRSYRRSWIRDGALTSSALLRLGHAADARAFLDWFLPYVFSDGKVPCCVDVRGADPVTENDADGELLYLAAEYWRMTKDTATVRRAWPTLARVARHLDVLRLSRHTAQYSTPDSLLVFGLLPPSISHEGYSAKPAYSFWDDFWGVRGMADAALLARLAGDAPATARFSRASLEFRTDVVAAVARSMRVHGMNRIPGAADLGDVDPTSTTIALEPAQLLGVLPDAAIRATFDSAWKTFTDRRDGRAAWEAFTPYEWRQVGSFVRLGQPERAHALADWFMTARRPAPWNQWGEVVWHDVRAPKFVGDMPHGWVASDFIRATLDLLAYEREADSTLVVGAGVPFAWANDARGVTVRGLRTWWGTLSLRESPVAGGIRVSVDGAHPPGGIELHAPFGRPFREARVNGRAVRTTNGMIVVRSPAIVEFLY